MDKLDGVISKDRYQELDSALSLGIRKIDRQIKEYSHGCVHHLDTALQVFELSQALPDKFVPFEPMKKRELLEIVCLNLKFDGASLYPTYRKPFDVLAEELEIQPGRGNWI